MLTPPPSIDNPPIWIPPSFLSRLFLFPLSLIFQKFQVPHGGSHYVENLRYYDMAISFVSNISCLSCYLCVFFTTAPFETEDNWINETKQWQQSQPEVIYETRDVST